MSVLIASIAKIRPIYAPYNARNRPVTPFFQPLFSGWINCLFWPGNERESAFMRSVKIVRLAKYGLFELVFKRSPNQAPIGSGKGESGLNTGPEQGNPDRDLQGDRTVPRRQKRANMAFFLSPRPSARTGKDRQRKRGY